MDKNIDSRINRLVGQIEGIRRMVQKKRSSIEVVQQILAARQALSRIGLLVLKGGMVGLSGPTKKRIEKVFEEVFRI